MRSFHKRTPGEAAFRLLERGSGLWRVADSLPKVRIVRSGRQACCLAAAEAAAHPPCSSAAGAPAIAGTPAPSLRGRAARLCCRRTLSAVRSRARSHRRAARSTAMTRTLPGRETVSPAALVGSLAALRMLPFSHRLPGQTSWLPLELHRDPNTGPEATSGRSRAGSAACDVIASTRVARLRTPRTQARR